MTIEKQIGLLLSLIFDIVNRPESPAKKQAKIIQMMEGNERFEEPFAEFISWFKMVEEESPSVNNESYEGNIEPDAVQPKKNP
jgi:hypothetical protein